MIAYIFTEPELKFLCGALNARGLEKRRFSEETLTKEECAQAVQSLSEKSFVEIRGEKIIVDSGIVFLIAAMGMAGRLFAGDNFTGYIAGEISLLLIDDPNSGSFMLYPFENEDNLIKWLYENEIYIWKDIKLEDR